MSDKAVSTPEQFLSAYPPHLQELANLLRGLVKQTLPKVIETVNTSWGLLGYRVPVGKRTANWGYIGVDGDHAHLYFAYGIMLMDPKHLLEGKGKKVRYLTIRRAQDIRKRDLTALILEASSIAEMKNKGALLKLEQEARTARSSEDVVKKVRKGRS